MKQILKLLLVVAFLLPGLTNAQRNTDKLNRGIVSLNVKEGNYVSWRIFGEEYYDVTYNLYRNGSRVATGLKVSNFVDKGAPANATYTVAAVVKGVEQPKSEGSRTAIKDPSNNYYLPVPVGKVFSRKNVDITDQYSINDVSLADLDGDGEVELLVKRLNMTDANELFLQSNDSYYNIIEAYKQNGTRLWWIDCGPNLVSGSSVELNIVAFDWDQDGKAECLMRGADNMIIHLANGKTYNVGNMNYNSRNTVSHVANMTYTNTGAEYLLYLEGATGTPYFAPMAFPLPRGNASDWGDGYGHRSSKYFFGAPYLDGRKPSMFMARGIYTKHAMVAFDVNPTTHQLTERWRWSNDRPKSIWYGQGNHNYNIADVDLDGRDEIVYGSMVIDDNGKGMSSTGRGHGDALHTGDFDPFRAGLETFACNEDEPGHNYRDATTCEILYEHHVSADDGRAMAGNFVNDYPGCIAASTTSGVLSCTSRKIIDGFVNDWNGRTPNPMALNYRIYWDGDLLEETINSPGIERDAIIIKANVGRIFQSNGCAMINYSKNNPCATGDILGDWREEMLLRSWDNKEIRIYLTPHPTQYRIPTLWHDHQYRQAMCWQMLGYNQPPHVSYFVGETEGFTAAPPAFTNTGRTEVFAGQTIGSTHNGKDVMFVNIDAANNELSVAEGAAPRQATFNVGSLVEGNHGAAIKWTFMWTKVNGGAFGGGMRLVKQGEGTLELPAVEQKYTGPTDVWAGTIWSDGKFKNSSFWLNRHTQLISNGGEFRSVRAEYNATIRPGYDNNDTRAVMTIDTLSLGYGSVVTLDVFGSDFTADQIKTKHLAIETKNWQYGPKYQQPVVRVINHGVVAGNYKVGEATTVAGRLDDIVVEGITGLGARIVKVGNDLILRVGNNIYDFDEGDFFLRNVATGDFLMAGGNWGTHAVTGSHALDFSFRSAGGGNFTIDSRIFNSSTNHFLSPTADDQPFVDQPTSNWKIEQVGENANGKIYTLSYVKGGATYRLTAPATPGNVTCSSVAASNALAQWQVFTQQDLVAMIAEATPQNPIDATFALEGAAFSRNDRRNNSWIWTFTDPKNLNHNVSGADEVNYCAESFHCAFDVAQTIYVPNGTYRISCQGFYRNDGAGEHPVFYANEKSMPLPSITSNGTKTADDNHTKLFEGVYVPDNMKQAGLAFANGEYSGNTLDVVVTNGELHLGVTTRGTNDWVIFDNFEIVCLGPDFGSMLQECILTAQNVESDYANMVGSRPFLYPEDAYKAFHDAIAAQQEVVKKGGVTKAGYEAGKDALQKATSAFLATKLNEPISGAAYRIMLASNGESLGLNLNVSNPGAFNLTVSDEESLVRIVKVDTMENVYMLMDAEGRCLATDAGNNSAWGLYGPDEAIVPQSNFFGVEALSDGSVIIYSANPTFSAWGWKLGAFESAPNARVAPYYYRTFPTINTWMISDVVKLPEVTPDPEPDPEPAPTGVQQKSIDNGFGIYGLDGRRRNKVQRGLNILHFSNGKSNLNLGK